MDSPTLLSMLFFCTLFFPFLLDDMENIKEKNGKETAIENIKAFPLVFSSKNSEEKERENFTGSHIFFIETPIPKLLSTGDHSYSHHHRAHRLLD